MGSLMRLLFFCWRALCQRAVGITGSAQAFPFPETLRESHAPTHLRQPKSLTGFTFPQPFP